MPDMKRRAMVVCTEDFSHDINHWPGADRDALTWPIVDDYLLWQDQSLLPAIERDRAEQEARRMGLTYRMG